MTEESLGKKRASDEKQTWSDHLLFLAGLTATVGCVWWYSARTKDRAAEMAVATGAAVAVMLMGRLRLFDVIKAGSVELHVRKAERVTREAEAAVQEAHEAIAQLKGAIETLSRLSLESIAIQGFYSVLPLANRLRAKTELVSVLRKLGFDLRTTKDIGASIDFVAKHTHVLRIMAAARKEISQSDDVARLPVVDRELSLLDDWGSRHVAPGARFRAVLEAHKVTGQEVEEALQDLEHLESTNELRRPSTWDKPEG